MPIDPTISLSAGAPQSGGQAAANPLETVSKLATIQNSLNQNQLFQQTYAARQLAGQIMSKADNIEDGFNQIAKSPAAPFMGEFLSQMRAAQKTQQDMEKTGQEMFQSGLTYAKKSAIEGSLTNPASLDTSLLGSLQGVPDSVRSKVLTAANAWRSSLIDGLPSDTAKWSQADKAKYLQRATAQAMNLGTTPDTIHTLVGKSSLQDFGGYKQQVFEPGMAFGIGAPFLGVGGKVPLGAPAARITGPGQTTTEAPPIIPGELGAGQQQVQTGGIPNPLGAGPQSYIEPPPATAKISGLGTPIVAPRMDSNTRLDLQGNPILSAAEHEANNERLKVFNSDDLKQYNSAKSTLAATASIRAAYDELMQEAEKGGTKGFLIPGTFGTQRAAIGKGFNTISALVGGKEIFPANKVAATEMLVKNSRQLGMTVVNQFFGQAREAAQTIENAYQSVPQIDNSYLGGILVNDSIAAGAKRLEDKREFQEQWVKNHRGNTSGMDTAFDRAFPAEKYTAQVLSQYGFRPDGKGFVSEAAIQNAVERGWITPKIALEAYKKQFGDKLPEKK